MFLADHLSRANQNNHSIVFLMLEALDAILALKITRKILEQFQTEYRSRRYFTYPQDNNFDRMANTERGSANQVSLILVLPWWTDHSKWCSIQRLRSNIPSATKTQGKAKNPFKPFRSRRLLLKGRDTQAILCNESRVTSFQIAFGSELL